MSAMADKPTTNPEARSERIQAVELAVAFASAHGALGVDDFYEVVTSIDAFLTTGAMPVDDKHALPGPRVVPLRSDGPPAA
jgi:hypothetical protein